MRKTRPQKEFIICTSRRKFLRTTAFLGPAAAVLLAGKSRTAAETPGKSFAPEGTRYRLTDHVRKYYETL